MSTRYPVAHGALDYAELAALGLRADELLDFSSNLNPFGPPPAVRAALAELDPAPYPDRSCIRLREALAARHGCATDQVLAGNGSNELLHLIARAMLGPGDDVLVVGPTFGEYAHASRLAGVQVEEWRACAERGFALEADDLAARIRRLHPRITWLCAPNNPTGSQLAAGQIRAIAEACAGVHGLLVVDRTYHELARGGSHEDWPAQLWPNVLQLHSLTKSYALAGLRLGYLLGDAELVARVGAYQPAWSVSSAAQAAGLAALADRTFLPATLPLLWGASDALYQGLAGLGLAVWRGALPFMLVRAGDGAAARAALLKRGCVVRDCASFGLPEWVRVAPRQPDENMILIHKWNEIANDKMTR